MEAGCDSLDLEPLNEEALQCASSFAETKFPNPKEANNIFRFHHDFWL